MLEHAKLPAKQGKPAQKQQRIPQQSLSYGTDISRSSNNAEAAPIQLLTLQGTKRSIVFNNLMEFIDFIETQELDPAKPISKFYITMNQLRILLDFNKISLVEVEYNGAETLRAIKKQVEDYLMKNPLETIKRLAESNSNYSLFSSKISGTQFVEKIKDKFTDTDAQTWVLNSINKHLEEYLQFGKALIHHSQMVRPDYPIIKEDDNIDPNDIKDDYVESHACAIVALMHAENSVFGTQDVKALHTILIKYFKSYPGQTEEENVNVKNNVWRNYSDDKVYSSMYDFFGYKPINVTKEEGNNLKTVCDHPDEYELIGKRGIIIVPDHAIGFRCPEGKMKLRDNDSGEFDVNGINPQHSGKAVSKIYVKTL